MNEQHKAETWSRTGTWFSSPVLLQEQINDGFYAPEPTRRPYSVERVTDVTDHPICTLPEEVDKGMAIELARMWAVDENPYPESFIELRDAENRLVAKFRPTMTGADHVKVRDEGTFFKADAPTSAGEE